MVVLRIIIIVRFIIAGIIVCLNKSHRLCVLICTDVISTTLAVCSAWQALALHYLWFAHGEADLQLQAILCRTEGGAMAEVPSTGVRTLLSNFQPYWDSRRLRVLNIRGCRLIGCPPDENLQTGTSDVLHCSIICWWETLYLGWVFFLLNIEHLRSARDVIPLPPYSLDR